MTAEDWGWHARVSAEVLESDLSNGAKVLYATLSLFADANDNAKVPFEVIKRYTKASDATLSRYLKELENGGFVQKDKRRKDNGKFSSTYKLLKRRSKPKKKQTNNDNKLVVPINHGNHAKT